MGKSQNRRKRKVPEKKHIPDAVKEKVFLADPYLKRRMFIALGVVAILGGLALAFFKDSITNWIVGK